MSSANPIAKLRFKEPCRNLPFHKNGKGEEWLFTYRFAQTYLSQASSSADDRRIAVAREIPANGYGIADLVAVSWRPTGKRLCSWEDFQRQGRPILKAFEIKLNNWRRALLQANRYRLFANSSIVVLPARNQNAALKYLETFRLLEVGLWSFDPVAKRIVRHYTPRPRKPQDTRQERQAVLLVSRATKALPTF